MSIYHLLTYTMLLCKPQMPINLPLHPPNIYVEISPLSTIILTVLSLSCYKCFGLGDRLSQAQVRLKPSRSLDGRPLRVVVTRMISLFKGKRETRMSG